jgi:DNA-binding HxlR family transcriptional regulator
MVKRRSPPDQRDAPVQRASIPVSAIVESVVGCKWAIRILELCSQGPRRPTALLKGIPGLSAKVLNERLRKMVRFGIMRRTVSGAKPPFEVEYGLTPLGLRFNGLLDEVRRLQDDVEKGRLHES